MISIFKIISLFLLAISWQSFVRKILHIINTRIEVSMNSIKDCASKINPNIDESDIKILNENEIKPFLLVQIKKGSLGFLTQIIGYLEIFIFIILTFALLKYDPNLFNFHTMKVLGITISTWMGLKIFGNYQQWSGPVFGRALFYTFLIGSLANIAGGIILGYFTHYFF